MQIPDATPIFRNVTLIFMPKWPNTPIWLTLFKTLGWVCFTFAREQDLHSPFPRSNPGLNIINEYVRFFCHVKYSLRTSFTSSGAIMAISVISIINNFKHSSTHITSHTHWFSRGTFDKDRMEIIVGVILNTFFLLGKDTDDLHKQFFVHFPLKPTYDLN